MFTTIPSWTTNSNCHGRVSLYEETVLENIEMLTNRKETKRAIQAAVDQANKVKDKEIELLPILQKLDGLTSDTKLLIKKLKQMENSIKELKKEILEE